MSKFKVGDIVRPTNEYMDNLLKMENFISYNSYITKDKLRIEGTIVSIKNQFGIDNYIVVWKEKHSPSDIYFEDDLEKVGEDGWFTTEIVKGKVKDVG